MFKIQEEIKDKLRKTAQKAYCPYSKFPVSALLIDNQGNHHLGFNIENAAHPSGMCAERVAIFSAKMQGVDLSQLKQVYVYGPNSVDLLSPCGGCLQVCSEHLSPETEFILLNKDFKSHMTTLKELVPFPIKRENIIYYE